MALQAERGEGGGVLRAQGTPGGAPWHLSPWLVSRGFLSGKEAETPYNMGGRGQCYRRWGGAGALLRLRAESFSVPEERSGDVPGAPSSWNGSGRAAPSCGEARGCRLRQD